jgi:hypothetical protein
MNEALKKLEKVKIALCVIHEASVVIYPSERNKPALSSFKRSRLLDMVRV